MSNDILDEAEKYTEPRTCPECGYQLPFRKFVLRFIMSYGFLKWSCPGCRVVLKSDFVKIQFWWLVGLLVFGVLFGVLAYYFDLGWLNIIFLLPFYIFVMLTLYYMKFEKY